MAKFTQVDSPPAHHSSLFLPLFLRRFPHLHCIRSNFFTDVDVPLPAALTPTRTELKTEAKSRMHKRTPSLRFLPTSLTSTSPAAYATHFLDGRTCQHQSLLLPCTVCLPLLSSPLEDRPAMKRPKNPALSFAFPLMFVSQLFTDRRPPVRRYEPCGPWRNCSGAHHADSCLSIELCSTARFSPRLWHCASE